MKLTGDGKLLRIFIGEADTYKHKPLFEVIVSKAKETGLAGATVIRGIEGYGARSRVIHTAKILRLSEDLPVIIEIVDTEEKLRNFIPVIDELFEQVKCGGLITIEKAEIIKYTHGRQDKE